MSWRRSQTGCGPAVRSVSLASDNPFALVSWLVVAGALLCAAIAYRDGYTHHFAVVADPDFPQWWDWADQGRYYRAAKAWASLSFDPSQHWYFPGYPVLGALFYHFAPSHPFYWVDLLCLLCFGLLLAMLAARLGPSRSLGRGVGAATFLVTTVLPPLMLKSFVEPWTTTPTAPLTLAAALLAFRFRDQPTTGRAAALGLTTASVALFRPVDVVPLGLPIGVFFLLSLPARRLRPLIAAIAAAAVPVACAVAAHVAIFGWHTSTYLQDSARTGFEWRLIPLHWVTLFVSPLPAFRDEFSLSQTFPWIIPGVAGAFACTLIPGASRPCHALIVAMLALHCLLYLAYRDLHPPGLFRYGNYHYFKWCIPLFGVYAALLLWQCARRRIGPVVAGSLIAGVMFSWRMVWREIPDPDLARARRLDSHTLAIPNAPQSVYDGLFVPAVGDFVPIYLLGNGMSAAGRFYGQHETVKAFPVDGGLIFTTLRPGAPGPATINFDANVQLLPAPPRMLHAHLFWRWPHVLAVTAAYYRRWQTAG